MSSPEGFARRTMRLEFAEGWVEAHKDEFEHVLAARLAQPPSVRAAPPVRRLRELPRRGLAEGFPMSLSSCCTNLRPDRPLRQRGAPWPAVSLAAGWSISRAQHISPGSSERHSRSDSPFSAYDYDEHRRDLPAIVTKLDLNDVTLVGWSTGGAIALKYVRDVGERVARLVLVGAVGPRFSQEPHQPFGMPADVMSALLEAERSNSPDARMGLHYVPVEKWQPRLSNSRPFLSTWLGPSLGTSTGDAASSRS